MTYLGIHHRVRQDGLIVQRWMSPDTWRRDATNWLKKQIPTKPAESISRRRTRYGVAQILRALDRDSRHIENCARELQDSGLLHELDEKAQFLQNELRQDSRGNRYKPGGIAASQGLYVYSIVRALAPRVVVETGVCNGFSSAFFLQGLTTNGHGRLYSIDLPRFVGDTTSSAHHEGSRSAVPAGFEPGWVVSEDLKERWELILGPTQDLLPNLLDRISPIDLFMHDSDHSYDCMTFEFAAAYPHLTSGGILMSHDTHRNSAFKEFAKARRARMFKIEGMGVLIKEPSSAP